MRVGCVKSSMFAFFDAIMTETDDNTTKSQACYCTILFLFFYRMLMSNLLAIATFLVYTILILMSPDK